LRELSSSQDRIRHAMATKIAKFYKRILTKAIWTTLSRFLALMKKHSWKFTLQIKAWRRYRVTNVIRQFLFDAKALGASVRVVGKFSAKVRKVQKFARSFLRCSLGRHAFLRSVLDEVAAQYMADLSAKMDQENYMADLKIDTKRDRPVNGKRSERVEVNLTLNQWRNVNDKFDALIVRQREQGNISKSAKNKLLQPLSPEVLHEMCWDLLRSKRREFLLNADVLSQKMHEDRKRKAAGAYTVDDVKFIMFPEEDHPDFRGKVRKIDIGEGAGADNNDKRPFFAFYNGLKPLGGVYAVLRELYDEKYNETYGNVVEREIERRMSMAEEQIAAMNSTAGIARGVSDAGAPSVSVSYSSSVFTYDSVPMSNGVLSGVSPKVSRTGSLNSRPSYGFDGEGVAEEVEDGSEYSYGEEATEIHDHESLDTAAEEVAEEADIPGMSRGDMKAFRESGR